MNNTFNRNRCFFLFLLLLSLTLFTGCPSAPDNEANKLGINAEEEAGAVAVAKSLVKEKTDAAEIEELAKKITGEIPSEDSFDEYSSGSDSDENSSQSDDSNENNSEMDSSATSSTESTSSEDKANSDQSSSDDSGMETADNSSEKPDNKSDSKESDSTDESSTTDKSQESSDSSSAKDSPNSESSITSDSMTDTSSDSNSSKSSNSSSDTANSSSNNDEEMTEEQNSESKDNSNKEESQNNDDTEKMSVSDDSSSEKSSKEKVSSLTTEQQEVAQKCFTELQKLHLGINQLFEKDKFELTDLSEGFQNLKNLCKEAPCDVNIKFTPYIIRKSRQMTIESKAPFQWTFVISDKNKKNEKRNSFILDASGDIPFIKITDEGKWKLAETALFLLGRYQFSLDNGSKNLLEGKFFTILDTEKATSSIYFPSGDVPQFLELLFKMDLVTDGGTQLATDTDFYMEPKGKDRITLPVYTYYQEEKEKREKERGSSFGTTTTGPSPATESIGAVIYGLFVDRFFESFGITDKNDVGFEIYIEDSEKNRLTLYQANP